LRPGGSLVALEYSVAGSRRARRLWTAVCRVVVNPLARFVSGDPELYRYLWRSVLGFESIQDFAARIGRAGFTDVAHRTVGGWQRDILHLVRGRRDPA
jgi:ubiquinone/menaquinone biosynthesis C-methylase UbiE